MITPDSNVEIKIRKLNFFNNIIIAIKVFNKKHEKK